MAVQPPPSRGQFSRRGNEVSAGLDPTPDEGAIKQTSGASLRTLR